MQRWTADESERDQADTHGMIGLGAMGLQFARHMRA